MLKLLINHLAEPFKAVLLDALKTTQGNQSQAAIYLGISRGSLRTYIKYFKLYPTETTRTTTVITKEYI